MHTSNKRWNSHKMISYICKYTCPNWIPASQPGIGSQRHWIKIDFMYSPILRAKLLWLIDPFTFFCRNISSHESDVTIPIRKTWTTINWLSILWKSDLSEKKRDFFQTLGVSFLMYGCTIWTLTIIMEKKQDENYTRMLRDFLNRY